MTIEAPFVSAWTKAFSPRSVTLAGGFVLGPIVILASFGTQFWHFVLSQGVLLGVGTCPSYISAVTAAPGGYDKRRGLAMGLITSGTGIGGVAWAPVLRTLNIAIGFRNTLRLSGAVSWRRMGRPGRMSAVVSLLECCWLLRVCVSFGRGLRAIGSAIGRAERSVGFM